jgi:hypothetical protein
MINSVLPVAAGPARPLPAFPIALFGAELIGQRFDAIVERGQVLMDPGDLLINGIPPRIHAAIATGRSRLRDRPAWH